MRDAVNPTPTLSWGGMKRYVVNLTEDERACLREMLKRQRLSAVKRERAMILLRADEGLVDEEIAEELQVGRATVERVRKRCVERGVAGAFERKAQENPSRPRKFDGASEAKLVKIACSPPPEGQARWTLSLLGDRLVELHVFDSVSKSSVQRALKKTRSSPGR
jgi:transposase